MRMPLCEWPAFSRSVTGPVAACRSSWDKRFAAPALPARMQPDHAMRDPEVSYYILIGHLFLQEKYRRTLQPVVTSCSAATRAECETSLGPDRPISYTRSGIWKRVCRRNAGISINLLSTRCDACLAVVPCWFMDDGKEQNGYKIAECADRLQGKSAGWSYLRSGPT
jgi:hypothetical protein